MTGDSEVTNTPASGDFVREAACGSPGIVREYWAFLRSSRKWWLAPILLILLLVSLLVVASGTAAAPFIYALF